MNKLHKVTLYIIEYNTDYGLEDIMINIENSCDDQGFKYFDSKTVDIEWCDEHPLNQSDNP